MKRLLLALALLWPFAAEAQTYPNHSAIIGAGSGTKSFKTAGPCTVGQTIVWPGVTGDPACGLPSGVGLVVGSTTISSGTTGRVLYDNAGVLGEYTTTLLTAQINLATTALSGALPAWPNNTTTFFRGDGTYTGVGIAALTGLGTGIGTALGVNVGTAGAPVINGGALGTPSSGTISTGVAIGGVTLTLGSDATGDMYYRNAGGILTRLGIGSTGNVITVAGGLPVWTSPSGGGNVSTTGTPANGQMAQWTGATNVQGISLTIPPQGRLTLATATPVMSSTVTAATTVYYTPYVGSVLSLYDGTNFAPTVFAELSAALGSNWTANSNYDFYAGLDSGTLRLCSGAVWSSDTARAEALVRTGGIWLNNASMTCRYNNTTTFTCAASRCTYLGTVRIGSAGQSNWIFAGVASGGTAGVFGVWNQYNRVRVETMVGDNTDSWSYNGAGVWRAADASSTIRVSAVRGQDEDGMDATYICQMIAGTAMQASCGVGLNSTSSPSGSVVLWAGTTLSVPLGARYSGLMGFGWNFVSALEYNSGSTNSGWFGDGGVGVNALQTGMHVTLIQ